jgi:hypothetical protein
MNRIMHGIATKRRGGALLATLLLFIAAAPLLAGGGWTDEPGKGAIRIGYDWKHQPDAKRLGTKGEAYRALFNMTLDYRFLYLSGDVGIIKGLEASWLFTYLWAAEEVDSTSEEPSHYYHGPSDMWLGLKYQIFDGAFPTAVSVNARLPYLYEAIGTENGQVLTEVPGLLENDYEASIAVSHSFDLGIYSTLTGGFRIKEGAATNQITFAAEAGGALPILDGRIGGKLVVDGAFAVGTPDESTSKDRFSGYSLEGKHFFDFNDASYIRPGVALYARITPWLDISAGYSYIAWGHSAVVYHDVFAQLGYSF